MELTLELFSYFYKQDIRIKIRLPWELVGTIDVDCEILVASE